jgi:RimJ/RimL family protein N-acetyltransferase
VKPVVLRTARLVLDQPTADDIDLVTEYCRDPVFEQFMSTPWPYQRSDAEKFVGTVVPRNWAKDAEYTWAVRSGGEFAGMLGFRTGNRDIGFWLGAPFRGRGYMTEAVGVLLDWAFEQDGRDVLWECYIGNLDSAGVARKAGFTFRGEGEALIPTRDGARPLAWKGTIARSDARDQKPGWPSS